MIIASIRRNKALTATALACSGLLLLWLFGSLMAAPRGSRVPAPAPPGRVVHLTTQSGVAIEANYWPGKHDDVPAVLLLHGIGASRSMFDAHASWLNRLGYAVLAPDFRGHGQSAARARTFGWREAEDAGASLAFLRAARPKARVAVIGVSLGGAAALLGTAGPLLADAMVLQAVYPDLRTAITNRIAIRTGSVIAHMLEPMLSYQSWPRYGIAPAQISPIAGLRGYKGPVLVIGGDQDQQTTAPDTRAMHAAAPGEKALWLVEGLDHVETCGLWTPEYRKRVGDFLRQTIGSP